MWGSVWIALVSLLAGLLACRAIARHHLRRYQRIAGEHGVERAGPMQLGGVPQWVSIRGHDRRNPVLVFLHGGPGSVFSGLSYSFQLPWEEFFTVVQWDQRGSGRSTCLGDGPVTLETLIGDALELLDYLRREFNQEKVFVVGHSWGGFLGFHVARRRPEWLHAFIALGPLLGIRQVYRETHALLTAAATAAGDQKALAKLRGAGSTLPDTVDAAFLKKLGDVLGMLPRKGMSWHNQRGALSIVARVVTIAFFSPDLRLRDVLRTLGGGRAYVLALFREIQDVYLPASLGTRFDTPLIFVAGEHDQQAGVELIRRYAEQVESPVTTFRLLRGCAHAAVWETPGQILEVLLKDALPLAQTRLSLDG